jgi:shikimate dehydrogenase
MAMSEPITAATRICAVYGHPIKHSASPAMQNAGITALGLNWRYVAFDVHPDNLREAIAGAKAMRFIGLNLTVPHKLLAVKMVDVIDESAKPWGAINTIRFEGRSGEGWTPLAELPADVETEIRSVGFNTDADAIVRSIDEDLGVKLAGARVLLLGAGGAGRAAALRLAREGAILKLQNRTRAKAEEIRAAIKNDFNGVDVEVVERELLQKDPIEMDLILNATSLGLKSGDALPIEEGQLRNAKAVYDMIYQPAETPLLKAAQAAGCKTANGLGMLLYQGAKALEIWSGKGAPIDAMRTALHQHVYAHV